MSNWNIFIILLFSSRNNIGKNYMVKLKKKERKGTLSRVLARF